MFNSQIKKTQFFILVTFFLVFFSMINSDFALAIDPSLSNSETGVRVSDFDNPVYGTWSGLQEDLSFEDDLCVFASKGSYRVNARGSGTNKNFEITDGSNIIKYLVYWNDVAYNAPGEIQLFTRKDSQIQQTAEKTNSTCNNSSSLTARLRIVFPYENLMGAIPGKYQGTLRISIKAI